MGKIYKIYLILFSIFSFISAQDFLKNVDARNIIIDKVLPVNPEDTIGIWHWSKFFYNLGNEALHPEGRLLAQVRSDPQGFIDGIYVIDLVTKKEVHVDELGELPQWSPDGKYLAFTRAKVLPEINPRTGRPRFGEHELWICKPFGEEKKKLTEKRHVVDFLWTQNSKFIVYQGYIVGSYRTLIAVVDIETGKETIIDTAGLYTDICFSVSPNGKMVVYSKPLKEELIHDWEVTDADLFIANIDGSYKKRLTNTKEVERFVKWLPDGKTLIVEQWGPGESKTVKILLKKIK